MLRRLLEVQEKAERSLAPRRKNGAPGDDDKKTRMRTGDIFHVVKEHDIRSATQLQARAEQLVRAGDSSLATFCTSMGTSKLQDIIDSAWAVRDAPKKLLPPRRASTNSGRVPQTRLASAAACGRLAQL